jgi:hypothetical protein
MKHARVVVLAASAALLVGCASELDQAAKDWAELVPLAPAEIRADAEQIAVMNRHMADGAPILAEMNKYEEPLARLMQWGQTHCNWPTIPSLKPPG